MNIQLQSNPYQKYWLPRLDWIFKPLFRTNYYEKISSSLSHAFHDLFRNFFCGWEKCDFLYHWWSGSIEADNLAGNSKYADQLERYQEKLKSAQSQFHDPWIMKWKYE